MFILPAPGRQITAKLVDRDAFTHEEQEQIKTLLRRIEHRLDNDPTNDPIDALAVRARRRSTCLDVADEPRGPEPTG